MTFEISKTFAFAAAHRLTGLPEGHKCARVHGHNYVVEVRLASASLDRRTGFVLDYGDLAPFGAWLDAELDHRWLGSGALTTEDGTKTDPVFYDTPTAELLAAYFRERLPGLVPGLGAVLAPAGDQAPEPITIQVGVSETPKTWAWSR